MSEIQPNHAAPCLELRITTSAIDEEMFANMAAQCDALGTGEESDMQTDTSCYTAWFPVTTDPKQQATIIAAFIQAGAAADAISLCQLDDSWETAWQKDWQAQAIGLQLCVRPSFCARLPGRSIDIVLDPGLAFGTGMHPTTRLCLEAIEQYCKKTPPRSMLDMGAGSGLLAIAAIKLGASHVTAIDYDPESVTACQSNATINNVHLSVGLGDTPPCTQFELVVANILAKPLLQMAEALAACTEKTLILSGLLQPQHFLIQTAYEAHGLKLLQHSHQSKDGDDWIALTFGRVKTLPV